MFTPLDTSALVESGSDVGSLVVAALVWADTELCGDGAVGETEDDAAVVAGAADVPVTAVVGESTVTPDAVVEGPTIVAEVVVES